MANAFIFSHPQRTEIKKAADESQSILENTPVGKGNDDGPLRAFLKVQIAFTMRGSLCCGVSYLPHLFMLQRQARKLRRLLNLLGCRDPEIDEPSASRSGTPSDPSSHHQGDDVSSSYAYLDDEGAVTQEV